MLKEATADNVTDVLEGVLTSGTAAGKGIGRPAAGKTGTTQDNRDSWFVGYTPTLSAAVFMGYDPPPPRRSRQLPRDGPRPDGRLLSPPRRGNASCGPRSQDVPVTDFNEPAPIREPPARSSSGSVAASRPRARCRSGGTGAWWPLRAGVATSRRAGTAHHDQHHDVVDHVAVSTSTTTTTRPGGLLGGSSVPVDQAVINR